MISFAKKLISMNTNTVRLFIITLLCSASIVASGQHKPTQNNWWPYQKAPENILICSFEKSEANLAQSLSGVVTQALNENLTGDGIWLKTDVEGYDNYLKMLAKRTGIVRLEEYDVWSLIERYSKKSIIKGYVLYNQKRGDASINLATVKCGLLKAVMIDLSQEQEAVRLGLQKLFDVTKSKSLTITDFLSLSTQLNRNLLVLANPKTPNNRDYAIAHKAMVYYGVDSLLNTILSWMKPLSPIIGWNEGPEFSHIAPCSYWGMINTASDWCYNLPLISCSSDDIKQSTATDVTKINWNEKKNYHSFVMSDGDNMQWSFSNFIHGPDYWSNEYNSELAMSFTTCAVNLSMAAPDVWATIVSKQAKNTSLVEYGGGYYYPDLFGKKADSGKLLRELAKIINLRMIETGVKVFGFICKDLNSESAQKAYQIFADEIDPLVGMIAVQYAPYNGGHGKVIWVKNKRGEAIPVLTAKYQVWANLDQEGSGNPAKISKCINRDSKENTSSYSWTIVHAWSNFSKDSKSEIIDCKSKNDVSQRGITPLKWGKELLNNDVKLVNIEELLWRIRMEKYPQETRKYINKN